jgi:cyclomaltodextrinase / maltogenic alpha-amylase / neopullulanase
LNRLIGACFIFVVLLFGSDHGFAQQQNEPEWARGAVWYLLIPDRFCNGDRTNDPTAASVFHDPKKNWEVSGWTSNWYRLSLKEQMSDPSFYSNAYLRQYGGDLEGISKKLEYLKNLGVNALILTPVFESGSSHKCDPDSYHHIDQHFGPKDARDTLLVKREIPEDPKTWCTTSADRRFYQLIDEIHRAGMKVVICAQFIHTSANFWAFKDLLQNQEQSKYGSWYEVEEWDKPETPKVSEFKYKSMWGINAFPKFRQDTLGLAPGPKEYIWAATKRWMDPNGDGNPADGIDGWCVDLMDDLPVRFWTAWTQFVKTLNPNAMIIHGQVDQSEADNKLTDTDIGKIFGQNASLFLLNHRTTPTQFEVAMGRHRAGISMVNTDIDINTIDNHETDRLASMCANRTLLYDEKNTPVKNPAYLIRRPSPGDRSLQKILVLLQLTYLGSPLIYYGDETGLWGGDDPDCRKPMLWPENKYDAENSFLINGDTTNYPVAFDSSIYSFYQILLKLRMDHIALRAGSMTTMILDDVSSIIAYQRESGADHIYVVINASDKPQECKLNLPDVVEGTRIEDPINHLYFYAKRDGISFVLPPSTGSILIVKI